MLEHPWWHQVTAQLVDLPTSHKRAIVQQLLDKEQGWGYNFAEAARKRMETYEHGCVGYIATATVVPQCGNSTADHRCALPQPDHKRQRGCGAPVLTVIKQYMHQHVQGMCWFDSSAMHPYPCAPRQSSSRWALGLRRSTVSCSKTSQAALRRCVCVDDAACAIGTTRPNIRAA